MDWDKINTLLDVVHKSLDVGNTNNIRAAALEELKVLNAPKAVAAPTIADPQLDLNIGARRI